MNSNTTPSWIRQNIYSLRINNCTLAGEWAAVYWRFPDLPILSTANMLHEGLSAYVTANDTGAPSEGEILQWLVQELRSDKWGIPNIMDDFVIKECLTEVCKRIGWQGFSDLAGIGMVVNYMIQATLTTIFYVILSFANSGWIKKWVTGLPRLKKGLIAIHHSARKLLDNAVIFASAMLSAATYIFITALRDTRVPLTLYTALITGYLSLWSVLPATLIYFTTSKDLRRNVGRWIAWIIVAILAALVISLWFVLLYKPGTYTSITGFDFEKIDDPEIQYKFDWWCVDLGHSLAFKKATLALISVLASLFLSVLIPIILCSHHSPIFKANERHLAFLKNQKNPWTKVLRVLRSCICLLAMWASLGLFLYYNFRWSKTGGTSNKENDLSFGQVLALSTWVPVVIEFVYIYLEGPEMALTGKVMAPLEVVEKTSNPEGSGASDSSKTT